MEVPEKDSGLGGTLRKPAVKNTSSNKCLLKTTMIMMEESWGGPQNWEEPY